MMMPAAASTLSAALFEERFRFVDRRKQKQIPGSSHVQSPIGPPESRPGSRVLS
jgi:hypothetical protein